MAGVGLYPAASFIIAQGEMYLILRHNTWVAYHEISPQYRGMLGRARFVRTTGESDHARAKIKAAEFEIEWRNKIEEIKGKSAVSIKNISNIGIFSDNFGKELSDNLHKALGGMDCYIDEWVKTLVNDTAKTVHMKKATVRKFCAEFGDIGSVRKKSVQEWINTQIEAKVSVATIRRSLSEVRGYWGYLQSLEHVEDENNPFDKLSLPKVAKTKIEAFSGSDFVALVAAAEADGDPVLADLIRLAAFTGGRIEELCGLRVEDITMEKIAIRGTKTEAADRVVPTHRDVWPTLVRMAGDRKSGYIFPDLKENMFGDRSNAIGKRFGRLKTAGKFGPEFVFHSLRKTFSNALWSAGVQRELISQMLGHETGHITTSTYASDPDFETKAAAIAKIRYEGYTGR